MKDFKMPSKIIKTLRHLNCVGAGLMELMVATGVMGILLLGAAQLTTTVSSYQTDTRAKTNFTWLMQAIQSQLAYGDSCLAAINGPGGNNLLLPGAVPADPGEITLFIPNAGGGVGANQNNVVAGQIFVNANLTVMSLTMTNLVPTQNGNLAPGLEEFMAEIFIRANNLSGAGTRILPAHLVTGLTLVRNKASGAITSCSTATSQSQAAACQAAKCAWDPVALACNCPSYPTGCPPYTYPITMVNGTFICSELGGGGLQSQCPVDANGIQTYLIGIGLNTNAASAACITYPAGGQKICFGINYCSEGLTGDGPTIPPPTLNCIAAINTPWSIGGNTCYSNAAISMLNGATAVLSATSGANQGSATFVCQNGVASVMASPTPICAPPPPPQPCVVLPYAATGSGPTSVDIQYIGTSDNAGATPTACQTCTATVTDTTTGVAAGALTLSPASTCTASLTETDNNYLLFNTVAGHSYTLAFANKSVTNAGSTGTGTCSQGACGTTPVTTAAGDCLLSHWIGTCSGQGMDESDWDLLIGHSKICGWSACSRCVCQANTGDTVCTQVSTGPTSARFTCAADANNTTPRMANCTVQPGTCRAGTTFSLNGTYPDAASCMAQVRSLFVPMGQGYFCCMKNNVAELFWTNHSSGPGGCP